MQPESATRRAAPTHIDLSQALAAFQAKAEARAERERFERRPWLVRAWLQLTGQAPGPTVS